MSLSPTQQSTINWTPEMDVNLFYAMIDHKPVGENKHFHMIFIYEKFNNLSDKKLTVEQIWQRLSSLYDLKELDENEIIPFPTDETEFSLPDFENASNNVSGDSESSTKQASSSFSSTKSETVQSKQKTIQPPASGRNNLNQSNTKTTAKKNR